MCPSRRDRTPCCKKWEKPKKNLIKGQIALTSYVLLLPEDLLHKVVNFFSSAFQKGSLEYCLLQVSQARD